MAALPTGTVLFLFTDIEGSTRLWEQYPKAMQTALARHDLLLTQAVETHGGQLFKKMGNQCCAAFAMAPAALGWITPLWTAVRFPHNGTLGDPSPIVKRIRNRLL